MNQGLAAEKWKRVGLGLAMIVAAAMLVFFSARPTLLCTRGANEGVDCEIQARALSLIPVHDNLVRGVRSVALVDSRETSESDTPAHLTFLTDGSAQDLGYFSQRFANEWRTLDEFARHSEAPQLRLTKELETRTVAAHLIAFLFLVVGGMLIRSAFHRDR